MKRVLDLHQEWLEDPEYAREYAALAEEFDLAAAVIKARLDAGLTQTDLATRMQTTQSVIARLEGGAALPSTRTLKRIAEATGTRLYISFEPAPARGDAVPTAGPGLVTPTVLLDRLRALLPDFRGRLSAGDGLAPLTWFRVGGPAEVLMVPADEDDLATALARIPADVPVMPLGLGSNVILRDGGVPGVVVRLGRGFNTIAVDPDHGVRAGAAVPDVKVARAAADAAIDGLAFFRGIPGSIGGALRMNAGAHGGETADVLVEARGVDRDGTVRTFTRAAMGFAYRHCSAPASVIFTAARFRGRAGDPSAILAEMDRITAAREASQPIRERTGGSTFKNPPGAKAWQLIDAAGCRGLAIGDAQMSEMHCNFLINRGAATARDIEALGEEVRRRVRETSGVTLEWEIKRIGLAP